MSSAHSYQDDFNFMQNFQTGSFKNVEEILTTLQKYRDTISQKIKYLEQKLDKNNITDREIAILIRQEQYLVALQNMPKFKISELFVEEEEQEDNVLHWYKQD